MSQFPSYLKRIEENNTNISSKAYISRLEEAATLTRSNPIDGDLSLTRMSAVCSIAFQANSMELVQLVQNSINALNTYRSLQGFKPSGIDQLVEMEEVKFFHMLLHVGFGVHQLRAVSYLLPYDLLLENDLLFLRERVIK